MSGPPDSRSGALPESSSAHAGPCSECGEALGPGDDSSTATGLRSGSWRYDSNWERTVGIDTETRPNCGGLSWGFTRDWTRYDERSGDPDPERGSETRR